MARLHGCRRLDELRHQSCRLVSPGGRLCWPNSEGREACRSAGAATDKVRVRDKSKDRQGAQPRNSGAATVFCRRGDRVMGWMAPLRHRGAKLVFSNNHQEKEPSMSEITTIGLDLAKHVFQV